MMSIWKEVVFSLLILLFPTEPAKPAASYKIFISPVLNFTIFSLDFRIPPSEIVQVNIPDLVPCTIEFPFKNILLSFF